MKKTTTLSLVAVAAFGLAACTGQQDQPYDGVGTTPATETPGAVSPGTTGPGTTGPGLAPGGPEATGTTDPAQMPDPMYDDTLTRPGVGTTPGEPGTMAPGTGVVPGAPGTGAGTAPGAGTGRP